MTTGPQDGVNTAAEKLTKTAQDVAGTASDTAAAVGDRVSVAVVVGVLARRNQH